LDGLERVSEDSKEIADKLEHFCKLDSDESVPHEMKSLVVEVIECAFQVQLALMEADLSKALLLEALDVTVRERLPNTTAQDILRASIYAHSNFSLEVRLSTLSLARRWDNEREVRLIPEEKVGEKLHRYDMQSLKKLKGLTELLNSHRINGV
jgi:hypothetical protein